MDDFFLHNLLIFARLLRSAGLYLPAERVNDLGRVLERIGVARRDDVYYAARSLFVRRREDLPIFDRAFELFFRIQGQPQQAVIDPTQVPVRRAFRPKKVQPMVEREIKRGQDKKDSSEPDPSGADKLMTYSPMDILRQKNFELFSPEEIREARRLIAAMSWQVGKRKTRRKRPASRGRQIDFAHLMRRNMKYGAELFQLPEREPKFKPRPLVVLADISGSMERYSRMVLHLLHTLSHQALAPRSNAGVARVETFVFSTRLTRITTDLKRRNVDDAITRVAQRVPDWSGGTQIGEAIKTFNFKWARRVLHAGAVVLIISDGWDRGDLELLSDEMARLQRSCSRLIWLNPLLGNPSFEATAQGLQVALPFVDDFLPAHNLVSLEMLIAKLSTLDGTRSLRRQKPRAILPEREISAAQKFMELPQMGTSDYVRRTMTLRNVNGATDLRYEENPDENQRA